jgi:hypothetical protein
LNASPPIGARVTRRAATLIVPLLSVALSAPPPATAVSPPGLSLVASDDSVVVWRWAPRQIPADFGIWVAAPDGDVELHARRPSYSDPVELTQVDSATGDLLRTLPTDLLRDWQGLRGFLKLRLRDASGAQVVGRTMDFCPNSYQRERLHDGGPLLPRYPEFCGFHPLTRGMVWGIEHGWAVNPFAWAVNTRKKLPDGTYTLEVWIAEPYRSLFEIPDGDAEVAISLTLRTRPRRQGHRASAAAPPRQYAAVPEVADPDPSTLPDLQAHPAWNLGVTREGRRDLLHFAATEWNAGPQPLVVEGYRQSGQARMDAFQYFYENGQAVGKSHVGELEFDPQRGHGHWHFMQFVRYSILDASEMEVVRSRKESFCLVPTDAVDLTVEGAEWRPQHVGLGSSCGLPRSLWIRETLDVGWGDTYLQDLPGQAFNITKLPNGPYYVSVHVNPKGSLFETDTTNNRTLRLIRLRGKPGARWVQVPPWNGIDI